MQWAKESECNFVVKFNTAYTIVKERHQRVLCVCQTMSSVHSLLAAVRIVSKMKNERAVKSRYLAVMVDSATNCPVQETEAVINLYVYLLLIIGNFKDST